ncbi:DNA repair protein RecN [Alkalilimnicola sp. S0819]|uniref:DNA repair protein RecN n=1 Tax=Alkalilimnicola sp. S0819 TaxID=2613922 RepID=UPI00126171AA|nr:DNA repair protein RecN [Alkalilimnicola sp. S0819]KAB7627903.1 DNA repair protein RecN [Alkalilimnicola sp. S0819]MPQ15539.1 DNA repair protein RecN [Alkalilimnicola sp. S0819]
MLSHLHIRDFALVERLELDLEPGMVALTGETGAGKSILLGALGLCLGERAESGAIRAGAERTEVSASFEIEELEPVRQWLAERELGEEECILRRVVQANGRSKAYINGRPVPLQSLKELGERLVDIHGQHAHQSLLRRDAQREILDGYAGNAPVLADLARGQSRLRDVEARIAQLEGGQEGYYERLDLLNYQIQELEALQMSAEDILELDQEQRRLANAGQLLESSQALLAMLYEDEQSVQNLLGLAGRRLEEQLALESALAEPHELVNGALVQVEEAADSLRRYLDRLELDPERLHWVEERIATLQDLARKHRVRPEELPRRLEALQAERDELSHAETRLLELRDEQHREQARYRELAEALSARRSEAAEALSRRVTEFIHELGMPGGAFRIDVRHDPEARATAHGLDRVEFLVRSNPGQPYQPIGKVASGGELSRIGLALEVATIESTRIPTLIFDEADSGIGGAVAEVVGRQLRTLGSRHQVFCVTHLPQVASQAHHQLKVSKSSTEDSTRTRVEVLDEAQRVEEIARMLGGVEITENTLSHASEMLQKAAN